MRYRDLLTIHGRTSRVGFWRAFLASAVVEAASFAAAIAVAIPAGWWGAPFFLLLALGEWIIIAASIRRLHDRGRSGWWYLIFYGPLLAALALTAAARDHGGAPAALALLILVGLGLALWGWVEIGFLSGRPGENRYGAPARGA